MKRPPRFTVARIPADSPSARVTGPELHHMRDVMRLGPGAEVMLLDPDSVEYVGKIRRFDSDSAVVDIMPTASERRVINPRITLAPALIKGPRMDFLVEKAAEVGAAALWPLVCARSVVRNPGAERLARWRRLAVTAVKQSLSPLTMDVGAPITVGDLVQKVPKETLAVICTPDGQPFGTIVRRARPRSVLIACGPEGGFDPTESAAMRAAQFQSARLGHNRLRSETAAIVALATVAAALDELEQDGGY